jgi:hypothetical protein
VLAFYGSAGKDIDFKGEMQTLFVLFILPLFLLKRIKDWRFFILVQPFIAIRKVFAIFNLTKSYPINIYPSIFTLKIGENSLIRNCRVP